MESQQEAIQRLQGYQYPFRLDYAFFRQWLDEPWWPFQDTVYIVMGQYPSQNQIYNSSLGSKIADSIAVHLAPEYVSEDRKLIVPIKAVEIGIQYARHFPIALEDAYKDKTGTDLAIEANSPIFLFFNKWARYDVWNLQQAICLLHSMCPTFAEYSHSSPRIVTAMSAPPKGNPYFPYDGTTYNETYELAYSSILSGTLKTSTGMHYVKPSEFLAWAEKKGLYPNQVLKELVRRNANENTEKPSIKKPEPLAYSSPYIELMQEAIQCFGISESNQPKKDLELVPWFEEQSSETLRISNNMAKMMATFVRLPESQIGGNKKIIPKG